MVVKGINKSNVDDNNFKKKTIENNPPLPHLADDHLRWSLAGNAPMVRRSPPAHSLLMPCVALVAALQHAGDVEWIAAGGRQPRISYLNHA